MTREEDLQETKKFLWFSRDSPEWNGDKKIVLIDVQQNCEVLKYSSDGLKNNQELVLVAVKRCGDALEYASDELRKDKEIILKATTNTYAYRYSLL